MEERELGTRHKGLLRELGQQPAECHKVRMSKGPVALENYRRLAKDEDRKLRNFL